MSILLKAAPLVESQNQQLTEKCQDLENQGLKPKMHVVLVGENPASKIYVKHKEKMCHKIGADFELTHLPEDTSEETFLKVVDDINNDPAVTGCFVQLPVPKQLQHIDTTVLINPEKDVDGFHTEAIAGLYKNSPDTFVPCTPKGIISLFDFYDIDLTGKNAVIIGRSLIVGKPLALLLTNKNSTVTVCHSRTKNLTEITKRADIIVTAMGVPKFLNTDYLREEHDQVIVDVGINKLDTGKLAGDCDFESIEDKVAAITPVPGGVGPLTILSLMENLVEATQRIINKKKENR